MKAGYVYVLTNPAMPGLVKIGRTARDPVSRCGELFNTSMPTPFDVFFAAYCDDAQRIERKVHKCLDALRVNHSREFFSAAPAAVKNLILRSMLDHQSEVYDLANMEAKLQRLADVAARFIGRKVSPADIVRSVEEMGCQELVDTVEHGMLMKSMDGMESRAATP